MEELQFSEKYYQKLLLEQAEALKKLNDNLINNNEKLTDTTLEVISANARLIKEIIDDII